MNKRALDALEVLRSEYLRVQGSSERYKFREELSQFVNDMRNEAIKHVRDGTDISVLEGSISIIARTNAIQVQVVRENIQLKDSIRKIKEKFDMDDLDWVETIMALEDFFGVEFCSDYEDYKFEETLTFEDVVLNIQDQKK